MWAHIAAFLESATYAAISEPMSRLSKSHEERHQLLKNYIPYPRGSHIHWLGPGSNLTLCSSVRQSKAMLGMHIHISLKTARQGNTGDRLYIRLYTGPWKLCGFMPTRGGRLTNTSLTHFTIGSGIGLAPNRWQAISWTMMTYCQLDIGTSVSETWSKYFLLRKYTWESVVCKIATV